MAGCFAFTKQFALREDGATVIEYAIFIAFITMACVVAMTALGVGMSEMFNRMNSKLSTMAT